MLYLFSLLVIALGAWVVLGCSHPVAVVMGSIALVVSGMILTVAFYRSGGPNPRRRRTNRPMTVGAPYLAADLARDKHGRPLHGVGKVAFTDYSKLAPAEKEHFRRNPVKKIAYTWRKRRKS